MDLFDCYVGIDLGSTTTKAVYLDRDERVLGMGITNSRSNYDLACAIAREEAGINSRFEILQTFLETQTNVGAMAPMLRSWLGVKFELSQHLQQLAALKQTCCDIVEAWDAPWAEGSAEPGHSAAYEQVLEQIFSEMAELAIPMFQPGSVARSDFFRDIASSQFLDAAERFSQDNAEVSFDRLTGVFDRAILIVEAKNFSDFEEHLEFARDETTAHPELSMFEEQIRSATEYAANISFNIVNKIGTGYGRATLPFERRQIRSEILCHGLGAHFMFPQTRTVLDIGGQDTKAIQVDEQGIVTNFQMNDRCAAGCGRYLGYIADEMNMGVHELGPLAMQAQKTTRINSTCTVFAGAELRERLALGERREDILSGLHRAIILRALSLLARSGGIRNEFTFTGGVAKNEAATSALRKLVFENYGELTMNVSPESIYTGALGAALFGKRDSDGRLAEVDVNKLRKRGAEPESQTQRHA